MNRPFRLVFAGTPEFAVPHLHACLAENVEIAAVYTQPDRPAGRGRALAASPVKQAALAAGLIVEQPESLKSLAAQARLHELAPDLLVVVAYGLILPRRVLEIPRLGCWNVHASLLPRWRGAAPIQRAILAGDTQTGVCLMRMEAGLDTGPVLLRREFSIASRDTGGSLHDKLAELGAQVLGDGLRRTLGGEVLHAEPQPEAGVTYAHKLEKSEARLDWNESAIALERKVRAFDPWPVAEADVSGERVRVWAAQALAGTGASPGTIVAAGKHGIDVACSEGALRILQLQRAGGRVVSAADYLNARPELKRA
ncbi:MAG: methionyl-tRNA formyltransferase [Proteobacteria bacterium]|nr:methionyl-tRNA formyltransferase [Pseudomonadota bacterium]